MEDAAHGRQQNTLTDAYVRSQISVGRVRLTRPRPSWCTNWRSFQPTRDLGVPAQINVQHEMMRLGAMLAADLRAALTNLMIMGKTTT